MSSLLDCERVAELFGLEVSTIWRRCRQGRMVPPPVMARPYRFSAVQVQQVIDGTYTSPPPVRRTAFRAPRERTA